MMHKKEISLCVFLSLLLIGCLAALSFVIIFQNTENFKTNLIPTIMQWSSGSKTQTTSEEKEPYRSAKQMFPKDGTGSRYWQRVGTTELYVFSAYADDVENVTRVIGAAPTVNKIKCSCSFKTSGVFGKSMPANLEVIPEHHNHIHSPVYITCPLNMKIKPSEIKITYGNGTAAVKIIYPATKRDHNFTACVKALYGPYKEAIRLIEMIEVDLILGVNHFVLYNLSVTPDVNTVLNYYKQKGIVEVITWNFPPLSTEYYGQLASNQDCLYVNRYKAKYLVYKDVDEFIVPHKHPDLIHLMAALHKPTSTTGLYQFMNVFFREIWKERNNYTFSIRGKSVQLKTLSCLWRSATKYDPGVRSKLILIPERVVTVGNHIAWRLSNNFQTTPVDRSVALSHHYRQIQPPTPGKITDKTMLKYGNKLTPNVKRVLSILNLKDF